MANLDDFFKKKDGKKSKGNKKFAVNNPLSLTSNEPVKNGKMKSEKHTSYNPTSLNNENDLFSSQNEDEWKEFEEEVKKDYSGLKIQNLQINDDENDKEKSKPEFEEEVEIDDNGQTVVKSVGPWKKIEEKPKPVEEKPPEKKVEPPKAPSGAYVPPQLRDMKSESSSSRKSKEAPPKAEFPSLSSTVPSSSRSKTKEK